MTTLKEVKAYAKSIGAEIVDDKIGSTHECTAEAPKGKIWACDDIHMLVDCSYIPFKPDYEDLLKRMKYGLNVCADSECEWCNPEE